MKRSVTAALVAVLVLTSCGAVRESRLNPFNWFGRSQEVEKVALPVVPEDPRGLVATVLTLNVEETAGGAIIRATGLPPTQGYWAAELVALPVDENGRLVLEFRIFPPVEPKPASTQVSREVVVALFMSNIKLDQVTEIIVQGEGNARAARR